MLDYLCIARDKYGMKFEGNRAARTAAAKQWCIENNIPVEEIYRKEQEKMQKWKEERLKEEVENYKKYKEAGTYRQQSAKFLRFLKKNKIEYKLNRFYDLKDSTRYFYIGELIFRFANHRQKTNGGFCVEKQERLGEADYSIDPTTGFTVDDAIEVIKKTIQKQL